MTRSWTGSLEDLNQLGVTFQINHLSGEGSAGSNHRLSWRSIHLEEQNKLLEAVRDQLEDSRGTAFENLVLARGPIPDDVLARMIATIDARQELRIPGREDERTRHRSRPRPEVDAEEGQESSKQCLTTLCRRQQAAPPNRSGRQVMNRLPREAREGLMRAWLGDPPTATSRSQLDRRRRGRGTRGGRDSRSHGARTRLHLITKWGDRVRNDPARSPPFCFRLRARSPADSNSSRSRPLDAGRALPAAALFLRDLRPRPRSRRGRPGRGGHPGT